MYTNIGEGRERETDRQTDRHTQTMTDRQTERKQKMKRKHPSTYHPPRPSLHCVGAIRASVTTLSTPTSAKDEREREGRQTDR